MQQQESSGSWLGPHHKIVFEDAALHALDVSELVNFLQGSFLILNTKLKLVNIILKNILIKILCPQNQVSSFLTMYKILGVLKIKILGEKSQRKNIF